MKHIFIVIAAALSASACESSRAEAPAGPPSAAAESTAEAPSNAETERIVSVMVTGSGYDPSSVEARAGAPLTLVFKRTTDEGCGQKLVFPDRDIRRDLPLNQEVKVELTPKKDETITFTCGMGMYRGSVVASPI